MYLLSNGDVNPHPSRAREWSISEVYEHNVDKGFTCLLEMQHSHW